MNHLLPGAILNRNCYKITRFIAQGGFGITYMAEEIGYFKKSGFDDDHYISHRYTEQVVVKELYYSDYCHREDTTGLVNISNSQKKTEFERLVNKQLEEGKILRKLSHPNIVRTRDIFKENGTAYMVMDYVESTDLDDLVKKTGKLQKRKAFYYIIQVLQAVNYIHDRKILHLDITPSNILIKKDSDEALLIDFGASLTYNTDNKANNNTSKLITGMKKHFAPVEQADIDNLKQFDATFDTYAIGATLYYLLTGQLPPVNSLVITGKEKIIPPSVLAESDQLNEYVDSVVLKAMAPKFHDRISSAADFEQLLRKEEEYVNKINLVNKLINKKYYEEAVGEINNAIYYFLETETLKKLKIICRTELEKKRKAEGLNWDSKTDDLFDTNTRYISTNAGNDTEVVATPPQPVREEFEVSIEIDPFAPKTSLKKRTVYFIIGAAISIGAGLLIVNMTKGGTSNQNKEPAAIENSTITIPDIQASAGTELSAEDLIRIKNFSKLPDLFSCSQDMIDLHTKIINAPSNQQSIDDVGEFERLFMQKCSSN